MLALDLGGQSARAVVFDDAGAVVAEAGAPIETGHPGEARVEHDPGQVVGALRAAIDGVAGAGGDVVAAGLATQRSSIVCWNRTDGTPLSPVISWQDRRGADQVKALASHAAGVRAATGLVLSPHYGASKLRWCLDNLPGVARAHADGTLAFGPIASFALFRLLDERPLLVDAANASRTQLWDFRSRDWSPQLLELFGVPRPALPDCVPNAHGYGHLRLGARRVPLTVCTGDQSAALFARGAPDDRAAWVNIGTGAFVQRPAGDGPAEIRGLLSSVVWQDADATTYVAEGTVNGAAAALNIVCEQVGVDAVDPAWLAADGDFPLYLNGVGGLGSPWWQADFESRFVGDGEPPQLVAAVVESIVFMLAVNIELMGADSVIVSGGLSQLDGLCARLADVTGLVVERPVVHEATARGLAWLVAGRPADWPDPGEPSRFEPSANPALSGRYRRWREAMPAV